MRQWMDGKRVRACVPRLGEPLRDRVADDHARSAEQVARRSAREADGPGAGDVHDAARPDLRHG